MQRKCHKDNSANELDFVAVVDGLSVWVLPISFKKRKRESATKANTCDRCIICTERKVLLKGERGTLP
jgi:hypothetical protein